MSAKSTIIDVVQTVVISFSAYMVIHLFLVQPNKIDGNSMTPTLLNQERILTNKIVYRSSQPQRGVIIVFTPPGELSGDYVKRIMAVPGDTILLENGQVLINGAVLLEPYLPENTKTVERRFLREGQEYIVKTDNYIVFGDNRNFSSDSREWGPITRKDIIGKASFIYWPLSKLGAVEH